MQRLLVLSLLVLFLAGSSIAGDVLDLDEGSFSKTVQDHPNVLVEFYAPWCGHCKALEPEYEKAASELKGQVPLARVDCTKHEKICNTYEVKGFPTILWFTRGFWSGYSGERTAAGLVGFVKAKTEELKKDAESKVEILTEATFPAEVARRDLMVEFYAPWCGHCQEMAPHYEEAAKKLADVVGVAKVNCDLNRDLCQKEFVKGYPAVKFYKSGQVYFYHGERNAEAFENWARDKIAEEKQPAVLVLSENNWNETLDANPNIIVEFYAPWCGHCKHFASDYGKAAETLKGTLAVAKVDCTQDGALCESQGVQGYPTIKLYLNKAPIDFNGERSADSLVNWAKKKLGGPFTKLTTADAVKEFLAKAPAAVGFFRQASGSEYDAYVNVANTNEDLAFGLVAEDAGLSAQFVDTVPGAVFARPENVGGQVKYSGASWAPEFSDWLLANQLGAVDELGPNNFRRYVAFGRPLVICFLDNDKKDEKEQLLTSLKNVAKDFEGKFTFGWSDGVQWRQVAERWYGEFTDLPVMVQLNFQDDKQLGYPQGLPVKEEPVKKWLTDIYEGKLKWKPKSQPIPETQGPLKVIVADTIEETINSEKDVLIEFYAPWCGHCQALAPTFEKLAETLKDVPSVVIGKFDATANDVKHLSTISSLVQGFPTIVFWPKDSKSAPIVYDRGRDLPDFLAFLKESASVKFEVPEGAAAAATPEPANPIQGDEHAGHNHHDDL
jgi:protein disulfide-isomerase-like protein